jgi:hypothetical protein
MVPSELPTESVSGRKNAGMIGPVKRRRDSFLKNLVPGVLSPIRKLLRYACSPVRYEAALTL